MMRILFLGRGILGYMVIKGILEKGKDVRAIVVHPSNTPDVSGDVKDFEKLAAKYDIPFYITRNIHDDFFIQLFRKLKIDLVVAMLWPQTVRDCITKTTKLGFINFHTGDLPRYRGNACLNWAILQGEKKVGLCVHFMEPGSLDSGDILLKHYLPVTKQTTITDLIKEATKIGMNMVLEVVEGLETGKLHPVKQNSKKALRCYPRLPCDGEIKWAETSEHIDRHIRSVMEPYPGAFTYYKGEKLYIWKAHPLENPPNYLGVPGHVVALQDDTIWVATGVGGILVLDIVQLEGGERISPRRLINSIRVRLGLNASEEIVNLKQRVEKLEKLISDK